MKVGANQQGKVCQYRPRFPLSNKSTEPPLPQSFLDEISQLKDGNQIHELEHIVFSARNPEKVRIAVEALASIGTIEAKQALLGALRSLHSKSEQIWPYVTGLFDEGDFTALMEIERTAALNPRRAARCKLPPEAQAILIQYLENNISQITAWNLEKLICSRYAAVSDKAFSMLLENDGPNIRKVLIRIIQGLGDRRKADRRAMLAFDEMLNRVTEKERRKLIAEACDSYSQAVSRKARGMLAEQNPRGFIRMIRKKDHLTGDDILILSKDGSPECIARIIEEGNHIWIHFTPSNELLAKIRTFIRALAGVKTADARKALISLLPKLVSGGPVYYSDEVAFLCGVLGARRAKTALPALKKVADEWTGVFMFAAIRAILDIEGVSPDDEANPYARKARETLSDNKRRLQEEKERTASVGYQVAEDLDIKKSDQGVERAWERDIAMCEYLLFGK
jgi:hypothetical protein